MLSWQRRLWMSVLCFLHFFTKIILFFCKLHPEFVFEFFISEICPVQIIWILLLLIWNLSKISYWIKSSYVKISNIKFVSKNKHFSDIFWICQNYFWTISDIFQTLIFYRKVSLHNSAINLFINIKEFIKKLIFCYLLIV